MQSSQAAAVTIRNAFKSYIITRSESDNILKNFSMTVPPGKLYSLIGSSGSGKTTVLNCLVGLTKLDKGTLSVFGSENVPVCSSRWQRIGFMPQEVSLYDSLTISETLQYFASIFATDKDHNNEKFLQTRMKFLTGLLHLPHGGRFVGTLSGGQRRRVSFAVALINEPELLILDEPTSGVDPLIRECIWNHLKVLTVTNGITVILTTHYVDEAKNSDIIGVMCRGRLIAEQSPTKLMDQYQLNSMDAVILQLSREHSIGSLIQISIMYDLHENPPTRPGRFRNYRNTLSRMKGMIVKNYTCMFRNIWMLAFSLLIPSLCMLFTCISFRDAPYGMSLGVVNLDLENSTHCSQIIHTESCTTKWLSCQFLNDVPSESIELVPFDSIRNANAAVEDGNIWGYVHFPKNYSSSILERYSMPAYMLSEEDDINFSLWNDSMITVSLDQTNTLIYGVIVEILFKTFEASQMRLLSQCGQDERIGQFALSYREPISGSNELTSLTYFAPGLAIGIMLFFQLTVAIRFIGEKRQGTVERCIVGGTQIWEILIAYAIPEFCILFVQAVLVFLIMRFGFSIGGNISSSDFVQCAALVLFLCILTGLAGLTSGFLLGILCREESHAALIIMAVVFPCSFISAVLWPAEGMVKVLQIISPFTPMTLPAHAMRSLMSQGDIYHPNVWKGFMVSLIYIIIPFTVTLVVVCKRFWRN